MPDSKSSQRIFFRLSNELTAALDGVLSELRRETFGEISDRSKAARYLLIEALRERHRFSQRCTSIEEALEALGDESSEDGPSEPPEQPDEVAWG